MKIFILCEKVDNRHERLTPVPVIIFVFDFEIINVVGVLALWILACCDIQTIIEE